MVRMKFGPDDDKAFGKRRDDLVADFAEWVSKLPLNVDPGDVGLLLDWKWGYGGGNLGRWRRRDIEEFLLEWCPRKLAAPPELVNGLPSTVALAMSFLSERGLHAGSEPVEQLTEHAVGLQTDFLAAMDDPSKHGMGKSLFGHLGIDDPTSLDPAALEQLIDEFNQQPFDVRDAALGTTIPSSPEIEPVGPVRLPDDDAVREAAEASPVLAGFEKLAAYLADPGKTLTAKGNLKIADAKALVDVLETGDVYEAVVGDKTFKKGSSTNFVEVDQWQWWAREAGAIRRRGNKLVGVKAWRERVRKDPVGEVRKAFDALVEYGPVSSWGTGFYTETDQLVDECLVLVLGRTLASDSPVEYEEIVAVLEEIRERLGVRELYPDAIRNPVDRTLTLLERCGVIVQDGVERTLGRFDIERRAGGTVRLTPIGVVLTVELLRANDYPVEVVARAEDLTAETLAALVLDSTEPTQWWPSATGWLDLQPDRGAALRDVVRALAAHGLPFVVVALDAASQEEHETVEAAARELAFSADDEPDHVAAIALGWLIDRDRVDPAGLDRDAVLDAVLTPLGALAEFDNSMVAEQLGEDRDVSEQLELIAMIMQRQPPGATALLEAIGRDNPNKVVAKAARKELYRLRSRLASSR